MPNRKLLLFCLCVFATNITTSLVYKFTGPKDVHRYDTMYGSDARGYYEYLEWAVSGKKINYKIAETYKRSNGRILKYTYGTALFQLPFYCAAKVLAPSQTNGLNYTPTHDFFMCLGAAVYIALALALLYLLLGKFTTDDFTKYTALTIIYLATNLFHYSAIELMMSHLYSFLSITAYFYFSLHYLDTKQQKHFRTSLFFLFLIIAIRPFNALIVIPMICYLYIQTRSFRHSFFSFIIIALAFSVQLLLWRLQCRIWTIASYDGEGFYWTNPQIVNVLFGFRKGLFIYSPVIFIATIGLLLNYRFNWKLYILFLSTCLLFVYAVSCWWHWPYGDGFGHRAFIDLYTLASIGLVFVLNYCKRLYQKIGLSLVFSFFIILNLFQTWQFGKFILPAEYMSYGKYKALLFKTDNKAIEDLGGTKDIFPFKAKYIKVRDSIHWIAMNAKEYSPRLTFKNHFVKHKKCYLDVSFIKEELLANQSQNARLFFQITDTISKESHVWSACLNEDTNDWSTVNTKEVSYQFDLSSLKSSEIISGFIRNPDRKKFVIKDFSASLYYILE